MESGCVYFQLKATDGLETREATQVIPFRLSWRDLRAWLREPMPVVLVLFDAAKERAFWYYIQRDFLAAQTRGRAAKTVTIYVPLANTIDVAAMRGLAGSETRFSNA